jgi:hypothetical protein
LTHVGIRLAILVAATLVAWSFAGVEANADAPPRAGLVVLFYDGTTREACVELGGENRTGEELLRLSGLDIVIDAGPLGTKVCSVEGVGCPADDCWCQCKTLGPDCRYWAYYRLQGGGWNYMSVGAAARVVRDGDVDGWAWGPGTYGSGEIPPVRSFDDLCMTTDEQATAEPTQPTSPSGSDEAPTPARSSAGLRHRHPKNCSDETHGQAVAR